MKTKRHPPNPDPENRSKHSVPPDFEPSHLTPQLGEDVDNLPGDRKTALKEASIAVGFARIGIIDAELLLIQARGNLKRVEKWLKRLEGEDGAGNAEVKAGRCC